MLLYENTSITSASTPTLIFSNMSCTPVACILRLISLPLAKVESGTLTVNGYRNKSLPSHHSVSVHTALTHSHPHDTSIWLSVTIHSP